MNIQEYLDALPEWECKDGRAVKLTDMDTNHLLNCIHKIRREKGWRDNWLPFLYMELGRRIVDEASRSLQ